MGRHHREPVLQKRRGRPLKMQGCVCQRCGKTFTTYRGELPPQTCAPCTVGAALVGVFGDCPGASGQ